MFLDLRDTLALLRAYDARELSRPELEAALASRVLTPPEPITEDTPPRSEAQALAYDLAEAICSTQGPDEALELFVRRVLECARDLSDPGDIMDMLPLIRFQDEFTILVSKHARGVISRSGMQSVIAKHFQFAAVRERLAAASGGELTVVCDLLESGDYKRLHAQLVGM